MNRFARSRCRGGGVALAATLIFPGLLLGFDTAKLGAIDDEIDASIARGEIPGAVFRLEREGEIYEKAYGNRALVPEREAMSVDTIFDAASLTKVLATAPSISLLVDRGLVDLDGKIIDLLPEFAPIPELRPLFRHKFDTSADTKSNRAAVTVRQLLTHTSGLPPSISIQSELWWGHENGVRRCLTTPLIARPGTVFRYSDVNYILLGEIVRRVSGSPLNEFAADEIFAPLGMTDTGFLPAPETVSRIAPTEAFGAYGVLRGEVHDPVSRRMQGVAGHAGLFTTAKDVASFARAFLDEENPVFRPELASRMTHPQQPAGISAKRGLGWDIDSPFSYQRGENFPLDGFGHTGWTGTSVWVDRGSKTVVVLMANRNHPTEDGRIKPLRIRVGTLAAEAVGITTKRPATAFNPVRSRTQQGRMQTAAGDPESSPIVENGIDVLAAEDFATLAGRKVGLITNHTGIDRHRRATIDLLHESPKVELRAIFAPEHGIRGKLDQANIDDETDAKTGLPIFSLYQSEDKKPTAVQLAGLDTLVFDIQDIGCRFYTYISTMGNAMEAASEHGLRFVVLDRVNPIGGDRVDGPVRLGEETFTAWHEIPVQHGMTVGELARLFDRERKLGLDLVVVPVRGWSREMRFDETGLPWVNPSPNMRNLTQAILYPGVGLLEFCALSVGRGTDTPFEIVGAPCIDDDVELAADLNREKLPGIRFVPIRFTPEASKFENEECGGVRLVLVDRDSVRPLDVGLTLAKVLLRRYGDGALRFRENFPTLLKHPPTLDAVTENRSLEEIRAGWEPRLGEFQGRRTGVLLYR
ncbi:MAG: DUF1343 domain-containing protein [Verrucomicrobiae bacterium]|nr:DUF1343 domain-containing protein [Verrucomicrobiae bacterium]